MKKALLLLTIISLAQFVSAQVVEKQYYIYNIFSFSGSLNNEGFKIDIDDGKTIKRLRDRDGNKMEFKTPAAALMYLNYLGWELYTHGATSAGNNFVGYDSGKTSTYWIMRKPCTKKEFVQAAFDGIARNKRFNDK